MGGPASPLRPHRQPPAGPEKPPGRRPQPSLHHWAGATAPLVSCRRGFAPSLNTANSAKFVLGSYTTVMMHMASSNDGL